jgi:hypothetical protein
LPTTEGSEGEFIACVIAGCELLMPENASGTTMSVAIFPEHAKLTIGQLVKLFPVLI